MGLRGHQPRQFLQGPRGPHHGAHLDPVPQEHDVQQGGQLPVEHHPGQPEAHRSGVHVGGGDGHPDQGHHPGEPGGQLADQSLEEGEAAVQEDQGGEGKQHVPVAGEAQGSFQPQQPLDQRGQGQDRQGQRQGNPEAPAEVLDPVAFVPAGMPPRRLVGRGPVCRRLVRRLMVGVRGMLGAVHGAPKILAIARIVKLESRRRLLPTEEQREQP